MRDRLSSRLGDFRTFSLFGSLSTTPIRKITDSASFFQNPSAHPAFIPLFLGVSVQVDANIQEV